MRTIDCQRASRVGAYAALLTGGLAVLALPPVRELLYLTPERLGFEIAGEHVVLATTVLALVLMVAGSLLFPDRDPPPSADAAAKEASHG